MKNKLQTLLVLGLMFASTFICSNAQVITDNDGNWSDTLVTLYNTPEAAIMIRVGDIDNLGYGWPAGFDPFSGKNTPTHPFPCNREGEYGTDKIMIPSSYGVAPRPGGSDGYTNCSNRPLNNAEALNVSFDVSNIEVHAALIQVFVDDFQAPVWHANYVVTLDSVRIPALENVINQLVQTGPIGRIINYQIPNELLYLLNDGKLSLFVDDPTTGAADGYAFDFIKLLINPGELVQKAIVVGTVKDKSTNEPLSRVQVLVNGQVKATTDQEGIYKITGLLPGLVNVQVQHSGYSAASESKILSDGDSVTVNFSMESPAPLLVYRYPDSAAMEVKSDFKLKMVFDSAMDTNVFNNSTFFLSDSFNIVTGNYLIVGDTLVFEPDTALINTHYQATLKFNMKSKVGKQLERDIVWDFYTQEFYTAAKRVHKNNVVNIYPNPANTEFLLSLAEDTKLPATLTLFNLVGAQQSTISVANRNQTVSIASFKDGTYFGVLNFNDGTKQTIKLNVHHEN